MLQITVPDTEYFDEANQTFLPVKGQTLQLEHSLISMSKWESKWHKPFLTKEDKPYEEFIDYIRCMTVTKNVDPLIYYAIPFEEHKRIADYLNDSMTATWFSEKNPEYRKPPSREIITSEIIYYWMIQYQIPFECEKWHLNRLMTLIRVCDAKSQPDQKMSRKATMAQNRALNAARRSRAHSRG